MLPSHTHARKHTHHTPYPADTHTLHVQPTPPLDYAALLAKANTVRRMLCFRSPDCSRHSALTRPATPPLTHRNALYPAAQVCRGRVSTAPELWRRHKTVSGGGRGNGGGGGRRVSLVPSTLSTSHARTFTTTTHKHRAQVSNGIRVNRQTLPSRHARGAALTLFRRVERAHRAVWPVRQRQRPVRRHPHRHCTQGGCEAFQLAAALPSRDACGVALAHLLVRSERAHWTVWSL